MFGAKHDVLELPSIPRERDKLRAIIGAARYQRRRSTMIRIVSTILVVVSLLMLMRLRPATTPAQAMVLSGHRTNALYLPIVMTRSISKSQGANR
jgi:hypothetical protein